MKYTIISVDDSRKRYKDEIDARLTQWDRIHSYCVDGRDHEDLCNAIDSFGYKITGNLKVGQLGVWYSVLHALQQAPLVTFEDDAVLNNMFLWNFSKRFAQVPNDADFFSLFLARNQDDRYDDRLSVSKYITRTYQSYGGVSMYYTAKGAERIHRLLRRDGIKGQYDDTLYEYSKSGELKGYCSKPELPDLVFITGNERSIVHETEEFNAR